MSATIELRADRVIILASNTAPPDMALRDVPGIVFIPFIGSEPVRARALGPACDVAAQGLDLRNEAADRVLGEQDADVVSAVGIDNTDIKMFDPADAGRSMFDRLRPDAYLLKILGHLRSFLRGDLHPATMTEGGAASSRPAGGQAA